MNKSFKKQPLAVQRGSSLPPFAGDIEDIERSNGRTCVIVDEGVNMARGSRNPVICLVFQGFLLGFLLGFVLGFFLRFSRVFSRVFVGFVLRFSRGFPGFF